MLDRLQKARCVSGQAGSLQSGLCCHSCQAFVPNGVLVTVVKEGSVLVRQVVENAAVASLPVAQEQPAGRTPSKAE